MRIFRNSGLTNLQKKTVMFQSSIRQSNSHCYLSIPNFDNKVESIKYIVQMTSICRMAHLVNKRMIINIYVAIHGAQLT